MAKNAEGKVSAREGFQPYTIPILWKPARSELGTSRRVERRRQPFVVIPPQMLPDSIWVRHK